MLFTNIANLTAKGIKIAIEVSAAGDGRLEVNVIPSTETGKSGLNLVAKSFVATPQELDMEFAEVINGFAGVNLTLQQQLEQVQAAATEVARLATEEAKAASKTKATSKANSSPSPKRSGPELSEEDDDDDDEVKGKPEQSGSCTNNQIAEPAPFML